MTTAWPPASPIPARITLLTDFGTADGYVGAMHGVIATLAPAAVIHDAGHDLPRGDIGAAAWALACYWDLHPEGTVHVVVVDPGVGTARRALAAEADGRRVVAPDNGCMSYVAVRARRFRVVAISNLRYMRSPVSATFHGRDVFAPAAAYLATNGALDDLGPQVSDPVFLPLSQPERTADGISGAVIHVDRFGNLTTNIPRHWLEDAANVEVDGRTIGGLRETYGLVDTGQPFALLGSAGYLEIAVRDGNAAEALGVGSGARIRIR